MHVWCLVLFVIYFIQYEAKMLAEKNIARLFLWLCCMLSYSQNWRSSCSVI